jgi:formylglycine-generating enzyme required for sulfatase activity
MPRRSPAGSIAPGAPGARGCATNSSGSAPPAGPTGGLDVTYGREPLAFGPDEVGAHPGSRSPVGADDMVGNVWEWTRSVQTPDAPVLRGGSWYQGELTARSLNRENGEPSLRTPLIGVRLCATPR